MASDDVEDNKGVPDFPSRINSRGVVKRAIVPARGLLVAGPCRYYDDWELGLVGVEGRKKGMHSQGCACPLPGP